MIPKDQLTSFERALRAGQYSLLFGAGVSTDSINILNQSIPGADQLRKSLCGQYDLDPSTSLPDAAEMLVSPTDREQLLIQPFTCKTPGRTLELMFRFCWRRIYTLNFDDVVEKLHELALKTETKPKQQKLIPFHFNDASVPEASDDELQLVHLHGTVQEPDKPIVLTLPQYGEITRNLKGWMVQLTDFLQSSPFIITGTRFSEPDLEHYLVGRTKQSSSAMQGPSLWIEPNPTPVTRAKCDRHGLLLVEDNFENFLVWLAKTYPDISAPWEQYALDIQGIFAATPLAESVKRFGSAFRLVRSYRTGKKARPASKFLFGQEPAWEDIREGLDIPREVTEDALQKIRQFSESNETKKRVFLITGYAGAGKTTILKRLATRLSAEQFIVLYVNPGKRIDIEATLECLNSITSTPILVADSLFECAREISQIIERASVGLTVVGAERDYRCGILKQILRGWNLEEFETGPTTRAVAEELLRSYRKHGLLALRGADKDVVASIVLDKEPIAVTVCRLLNDYRPLDSIVDSLWADSDKASRFLYLSCTIAAHCVSEGLRWEIAHAIATSAETHLDKLLTGHVHPLRLTVEFLSSVRDDFIRPESGAISERLLERCKHNRDVESLYPTFISLAKSVSSYVTKETILKRTPEARLAARLFDVDFILHACLGDKVDKFFREVQAQWEWHSQYWAQRGLALKNSNIRLAIQYARNAVRIEPNHPSTLTTLGTLLLEFGKQTEWKTEDANSVFEEAVSIQEHAITSAFAMRRWDSEHAWTTLFYGAVHYINSGKPMKSNIREKLENVITKTKAERGRFSPAINHSIAELEMKISEFSS